MESAKRARRTKYLCDFEVLARVRPGKPLQAIICILGAAIVNTLVVTSVGYTQSPPYTPDIEVFEGDATFQFETQSVFKPGREFTVEFWVATGWQEDPGFDPVILSTGSVSSPEFMLAVLADRDGFEFLINNQEVYIAHDLANEHLHHIAGVWSEGEMALVANGYVVGVFNVSPPVIESELFWIGSAFGEGLTYMGSIGQVRFWDAALDPETLRAFAFSDVAALSSTHPYLESLRAISAFEEDTLLIVDGVIE